MGLLLRPEEKTSLILGEIGKITRSQALDFPILKNYKDKENFEKSFIRVLKDIELILGTNTHFIDILCNRFLTYWEFESTGVLMKFLEWASFGPRKIYGKTLDLPTLNDWFIDFKQDYITEMENRHKSTDQGKREGMIKLYKDVIEKQKNDDNAERKGFLKRIPK